jgi:hypothetical protein
VPPPKRPEPRLPPLLEVRWSRGIVKNMRLTMAKRPIYYHLEVEASDTTQVSDIFLNAIKEAMVRAGTEVRAKISLLPSEVITCTFEYWNPDKERMVKVKIEDLEEV